MRTALDVVFRFMRSPRDRIEMRGMTTERLSQRFVAGQVAGTCLNACAKCAARRIQSIAKMAKGRSPSDREEKAANTAHPYLLHCCNLRPWFGSSSWSK
ncbi:hypothetical protein HBI56_088870 [Parastagonospora nodorum]|nr:hypothetical protein HBH51_091950 [Parastagonospora nodorum]KAH4266456.1 hypothetical protein HBI03_076440 [Parastagonospora nodorum]KAH4275607.1 hypothetical protein HBI04_123620 [Parastagonospora nodorum]KAH4347862.1 hypothetical protein HBH98_086790 [Parastagonospora nodorum]KAH4377451.1 hypothetical protein HBH97_109160 [Parastagonospora nodorum]